MSQVIDHAYQWYQEVAPRDFYSEGDLERAVMHNLELMFPEFKAFAFKQTLIHSATGKGNAPDLGMVKSDYSEWYVIEVELGKHSSKEVEVQIDTFRNCTYSKVNSDYITKENPGKFDPGKLESLIVSRQPELMVIVNEEKTDWKGPLQKLKCKTCIFQIYNDYAGRHMYRLDGEHPFVASDFSYCKYEKSVDYVIKILRRDFLDGYGIPNGITVNIEYNGVISKWKRVDSGKDVFLICDSKIPPLDSLCHKYRLNYSQRKIVAHSAFASSLKNKKHHRKQSKPKTTAPTRNASVFTFTKA